MFDQLDNVPWDQLTHCRGPASDAPGWIRDLISDDEKARMFAVDDFLFDRIIHQYTLYPATPHVVPFVIEALADGVLCEKSAGVNSMKTELLLFLHTCAMVSFHNDDVRREVIKGKSTYEKFVNDPNDNTRKYALELIDFCDGKEIPTPPKTPWEDKMLKRGNGFFAWIKSLMKAE